MEPRKTKKIILMGRMGAGKSTLFNKLSTFNTNSSFGSEACTKEITAVKINEELTVIDTPGIDDLHTPFAEFFDILIKKFKDFSMVIYAISALSYRLSQGICDDITSLF
jgi:small GTP-binding protein